MTAVQPSKEQRYDRQLRLWGDRGQIVLENSSVCLIGAKAVGTELLKNLVLPGIGSYTIIDNALVCKSDLGNNSAYLGKPRALAATELLSELNPNVRGHFIVDSFDEIMDKDPNFFLQFSVIVYTGIRDSQLIKLHRIVACAYIPIVVCLSIGFIGFLRVSLLEHAVIESHPDASKPDFRLDNPPEGLVELVNSPENALDSLPATELAHVPWLIVVFKFVQHFKECNGRYPSSYSDKQAIRKSIDEAAENLLEQCRQRGETLEPLFELTNFREAARAVNTAIAETKIPPEVVEIFEDSHCVWPNTTTSSGSSPYHPSPKCLKEAQTRNPITNLNMDNFWMLAGGLKQYVVHDGRGLLPLRGDLPDMTSSSDRYLKLLAVYREHADLAVNQLASRLSHISGLNFDDVRFLAKNAAYLRVIKCRSLEEELKLSPARSDSLQLVPCQEENDAMLWYFMFRAASGFVGEHGRWPGTSAGDAQQPQTSQSTELDLPSLRHHVNRVLTAAGIAPSSVCDDYVHEMCRFGGGEIHSIAAFMGGIAAQEVIKLITHQFVPISQPLIYNGIKQQASIVQL